MSIPTTPRGTASAAGSAAGAHVVLRLFASARHVVGAGRVELQAPTVAAALADAERRFGDEFSAVLRTSRVWVNGAPAEPGTVLADGDEVAVLPPVSGGAGWSPVPGGAGWSPVPGGAGWSPVPGGAGWSPVPGGDLEPGR